MALSLYFALAFLAVIPLAILALRKGVIAGESAQIEREVYKKQLEGISRDFERGVIDEGDAARMKIEISRRLLAADSATKVEAQAADGRAMPYVLSGGILLIVIASAFALYQEVGAFGMADLPQEQRIAAANEQFLSRPSQTEIEARVPPQADIEANPEFLALMTQLRAAVAQRPNDAQGLRLLAQNEARLGDYKAAYQAQGKLNTLLGDRASADDFFAEAQYLIEAAGGAYVSPEAEQALRQTLAKDVEHIGARFYVGLMLAQNDRPDLAFGHWNFVLNRSNPQSPWYAFVRENIEALAFRAGEKITLPPVVSANAPGPDAQAIEDAANMSQADRQNMIESMVERLQDRLATEGGSVDEWVRLIGSLSILGRGDDAQKITDEALANFASNPDALEKIRAAAQRAGLN